MSPSSLYATGTSWSSMRSRSGIAIFVMTPGARKPTPPTWIWSSAWRTTRSLNGTTRDWCPGELPTCSAPRDRMDASGGVVEDGGRRARRGTRCVSRTRACEDWNEDGFPRREAPPGELDAYLAFLLEHTGLPRRVIDTVLAA